MHWLWTLTIVAALPATGPVAVRDPDAKVVFASDFEQAAASTAEALPPGWTRRRDDAHPHYLFVGLAGGASSGRTCLRMALDGGAAEITSQVIPLEPQQTYFVEAFVKTDRLVHDCALVALLLRNSSDKQQPPRVIPSQSVTGTTDWTRVTIGPLDVERAGDAQLALTLGPADDQPDDFDLAGRAWFDDIRVIQTPRMRLETTDTLHFYRSGDEVEVTCLIWGTKAAPRLAVSLEDVRNTVPEAATRVDAQPTSGQAGAWTWRWRQKFDRPGYYRLHVSRLDRDEVLDERTLGLAVAEPQSAGVRMAGDFGWSLPGVDADALAGSRLRLLEEAGVGWVKVPLWPMSGKPVATHQVVDLLEALRQRRIDVLGQLDPPPAAKNAPPSTAAASFAALSDEQLASLAGVLARFGLQVGAWQLGNDRDTTMARETDPTAWRRLAEQLAAAAGDLRLGVVWPLGLTPPTNSWPWKIIALEASDERDDRMMLADIAAARQRGLSVFANVDAPAEPGATAIERAERLLHRLIDLKVAGAEYVGVSKPFAPEQGLLAADGSCGELFLPWRTTAQAIGGGKFAGRWRLPSGSENRVFLNGRHATIVVWNQRPTREQLFLGDDVVAIDAFGARRPISTVDGQQALDVDRLPTFIVHLDGASSAWRLAAQLEQDRFPSEFGVRRSTLLRITNTFAKPVSGSVRIHPPHEWKVHPNRLEFELAPGASTRLPLELSIPLSGTTGEHVLRADFDFTASGGPRFASWLPVILADPELELTHHATITSGGDLEVRQRLINLSTTPASFHCNLYAPGERRQRHEVVGLAGGENVQVYRIADGGRFRGKTLWLRVEEVGGPRVLSYRFTVQ